MWFEYAPDTGKILSVLYIPDETAEAAIKEFGAHLIKSETDVSMTHYVDLSSIPPVLKPRLSQFTVQDKQEILANGQDELKLSNLPVPCEVSFNQFAYQVDDGELTWTTLMPAIYQIKVEAFPFLDFESEVKAVEGNVQAVSRAS